MEHPTADQVSGPADVADWYWTRAELDAIARRLGVPRTGSKADLTRRLIAVLGGKQPPATSLPARGRQLHPPYSVHDTVPAGQRMSRSLRDWFVAQIGDGFVVDTTLREFLAEPDGRTLGDAVELLHTSRGRTREIPAQFEYNRFTRAYRTSHPGVTADEVRQAWAQYKSLPVAQRGRI